VRCAGGRLHGDADGLNQIALVQGFLASLAFLPSIVQGVRCHAYVWNVSPVPSSMQEARFSSRPLGSVSNRGMRCVWLVLQYALVGTWLTVIFFGQRLMRLTFWVLQREGDLRFDLVRVRENAGRWCLSGHRH
jgi:ABC-type uncharacterized transport system fused permease/ATPase subunit